jgi:general secretion pathway protein L
MNSMSGSDKFRLFGLDLAAVSRYFSDGWADALQWPIFRWLKFDSPVRVVRADGTESFRRGSSAKEIRAPRKPAFNALALDEESVLRRSILLPRLSEPEIRQAAELDAQAASPFLESELVWGFAVDQRKRDAVKVDIALTSRQLIDAQIVQCGERFGALPTGIEIWADGEPPIVMPGYGEARRAASSVRYRRVFLGLLVLAILLACLRAVSPTIQLRKRVVEANAKTEDLVRKVKPQAQMRDELTRLNDQLRKLDAVARQRVDLLALVNDLTKKVPDDTMLTRFELTNNVVRISGQGDNVAQLIQSLGNEAGFRDVRAPTGIARAPAGGKESFTIEFNVGPGAKTP